jgi:hypothetical protein
MTADRQELIDALAISLTNYDHTEEEIAATAEAALAALGCTGPELIAKLRAPLYGIIGLPLVYDMFDIPCVDKVTAIDSLGLARAEAHMQTDRCAPSNP